MKTKMRIIGMNKIGDTGMRNHKCGSVYFVDCDGKVGSMFFAGSQHGADGELRTLSTLSVCWRDKKGEMQSLDVKNHGQNSAESVFSTKDGPVTLTVRNGRIFLKMPKEFTLTHRETWYKCN